MCVRPGECRCRHGYFGANCDTSEYRRCPRVLRGFAREALRCWLIWGDFPQQNIRDGAADALLLLFSVPQLCPQGIVPLEGSPLRSGALGGWGDCGQEGPLGLGVSTGAQWWGCPTGSARADGSAHRMSPAVLGSRLQGDVQLPPQRAMRGRDGPVHLQPQPLGSQVRERLPLQARQVRPEDGQMHL